MPGLTHGSTSGLLARGRCRRQRIHRRGARDGAHEISATCGSCAHQATWASARPTTSPSARAAANWSCFSIPTPSFPPGPSTTLVAVLRSDPAAAAVGPRLVDGAGRAELSFGPMPSPWGEAWQRWLGRSHAPRILARAPVGRVDDPPCAHGRMGQRRVPARPPGRCRSGRAPGRAILPVLGRRRLLRSLACASDGTSDSRPLSR